MHYLGKFHHSDSSTIGHSFVLDNYIKIIIIPLAVSLWNNSGTKAKGSGGQTLDPSIVSRDQAAGQQQHQNSEMKRWALVWWGKRRRNE